MGRVWLFRGLVAVAAGLMLLSWFMPWWTASIDVLPGIGNALIIHPYGLEQHLGSLVSYLPAGGVDMPVWFAPLMWIYLAVAVGLILYSLWLKGKWGKLLVGGVGLSYIVVAVLAVIVAAIRTGEFGVSLLGYTFVSMGEVVGGEVLPEAETGLDATLRFWYFMAYGVGLLCIILALLRDKIIGKPKPSA